MTTDAKEIIKAIYIKTYQEYDKFVLQWARADKDKEYIAKLHMECCKTRLETMEHLAFVLLGENEFLREAIK